MTPNAIIPDAKVPRYLAGVKYAVRPSYLHRSASPAASGLTGVALLWLTPCKQRRLRRADSPARKSGALTRPGVDTRLSSRGLTA